ncbi:MULTISPECIES: phosphatidylserine decarboxylase family protein [Duncaniella]|jgi:phosphatidylserine decarboxylase|uniref:Phosphatidylserine decarboxylase proenzyme n=1 Tax=Duncaniella muris TaxID=2094150 RepID=A0A2V1IQW7_9BACT|nr:MULTISPECIES: phosphatidylserine decarboxylase family protein [Duncaniella]NBH91936.1 phosphatidylserine decarboxylase family protein [Muribaculaceae bacterium S4]NBI19906.1 phosphatidylserine decarboxylase family protein [Muribaculaceae bacterium Z1]ROS90747.1 phosphatidylserine decarboxylase family protein [Muribaculaceae bacterium Isolate-039 (Harlan)]ROS95647.1 phosphatidylserine decarboxylase family protein [Muribaculaceae bacterium Isolate-083 (Janvier)]ROS98691.1 phosphatidylserine d
MKVKIHSEGINILIVVMLIMIVINLSAWMFIRPAAIPTTFTVISAIFYLLVVNFFRSPKRAFHGDRHNVVVSSVDGTVVALEEVFEPEVLRRRVRMLSVFMSVFNVHANWFPVDGEVLMVRHHSGRFLSAYLPKASIENERSTVLIRATNGQEVLMRQIAGAVARRIVTYAEPGDIADIKDHMGFIKFGSRVDIYLPLDAEVFVKIGDKTTGGVSVVARLREHPDD